MTTGERLVDISTLLTGTALEHFLNIQTGGGSISTILDVILKPKPLVIIDMADVIEVETDSPLMVEINKLPNVDIEEDEIQV